MNGTLTMTDILAYLHLCCGHKIACMRNQEPNRDGVQVMQVHIGGCDAAWKAWKAQEPVLVQVELINAEEDDESGND